MRPLMPGKPATRSRDIFWFAPFQKDFGKNKGGKGNGKMDYAEPVIFKILAIK
jgi:hypothetical protein